MSNEDRGADLDRRLSALGISKIEFSARAGIDRGTLDRAIDGDEKVSPRTWTKITRAVEALEEELGMAESGSLVVTTIEIRGAKVTIKGKPADVADAVRQMLV